MPLPLLDAQSGAGTAALDDNLVIDACAQLVNVTDDAHELVAVLGTREHAHRERQRLLIKRAKALVHEHRVKLDAAGMRLHLIHAAMLGDEALRAKLIDRYAAFERLIAEKIAERTDVVSADYLTQLILLASDGMIVQEALRNDNFDAAAFVRQSEAYLRVLRPADRI